MAKAKSVATMLDLVGRVHVGEELGWPRNEVERTATDLAGFVLKIMLEAEGAVMLAFDDWRPPEEQQAPRPAPTEGLGPFA